MVTTLPPTAILGAGSMGGAVLSGLLRPDVVVEGGVRVTNRSAEKAAALRGEGVTSLATSEQPDANVRAVAGARLVLVGVKPHLVVDLLREVGPALDEGAIVVSLAAGVTTATMEAVLPGHVRVVRSMPNTPSVVGLGVTGLAAGARASDEDLELARSLFAVVGEVVVLPEDRIDALSTISGSGPAYVFFLVEQLQRTAVGLGFTPAEAATMVQGTFRGAAELLAASDVGPAAEAPAELRRRVTSPGGTTERAIAELEAADLAATFDRATAAALARAREIAAS